MIKVGVKVLGRYSEYGVKVTYGGKGGCEGAGVDCVNVVV